VKSTGETDSILPQQYGFAMQKNSSLTPKVDAAIQALRADGTYGKFISNGLTNNLNNPRQAG
jgi:glutamine transport system substrate-binding protein